MIGVSDGENEYEFVLVVRCKDCAYWQAEWETSAHDPNWHYCSQNDTAFSATDFCSRGERKDEVTE